MEVKEILKNKGPKVWSVQSDDTIRDAITTLVKNKIGALLVFDEKDKMVGIISERDIMRECFHNAEKYASTPVHKVMTKKVIIGRPEDKSDYIMGIMTQNRVRHIPIIADGKLHGLVSIGDVVKAQLQDSQYQIQYLKDYICG
ncbi:MAG: CBS domain-containing protein [Candidatus Omnitrophota bacterium]|nr:CBS domain-containing protein [Candidatus Omnitrophota bacterium]